VSFVVISGLPRSGTSLVCDIVQQCGYDFGPVTINDDNPTKNRHEWRFMHTAEQGRFHQFALDCMEHDITALKVGCNWDKWIDMLRIKFNDIRVITVMRDTTSIEKSRLDYGIGPNFANQNHIAAEMVGITNLHCSSNSHMVTFEQLLRGHPDTLNGIINHIDGDANAEDLSKLIHPDQVRF